MNRTDLVAIADGLRMIEEGVSKIQTVMRKTNVKSIADMASELIPLLKKDDDSINEDIIQHLGNK